MKNLLYSVMIVGLMVLSAGAMLFVGCDSPDKLGTGGAGGGISGTTVINLDAAVGSKGGSGGGGNTGAPPTDDANCGSVTQNTSHLPADVLLVLDRSGSMSWSIAGDCCCSQDGCTGTRTMCSDTNNCTVRWPALTSAVGATLTSAKDIRWGLKLYSTPGEGSCSVNNGVEVQISDNSTSAIQQEIAGVSPQNNTPTAAAITAATAYVRTLTDPNNKVILLATDGEPNCRGGSGSNSDVDGTIAAITAAKNAGVLVYVIGIGPSVGNLDNFAQAGGTTSYFPATSAAELAAALQAISTAVTNCTFTAAAPPPDPNNVAVYLDKKLVQQDPANGWSFGANNRTIVLNGSTCEKVKSSAASNVQILFGCPGDVEPPPPTIP